MIMKLQLEHMKKFSWGVSRSTHNLHHKVVKFTSAYGLGDAQKTTMRDLQRYLRTKKISSTHGSMECVHQSIRIYLAETLLQIVTEKSRTYRYYFHRFLGLLEHYQSADPTFFMDEDFDKIVKNPLEKHAKKYVWSYSHHEHETV